MMNTHWKKTKSLMKKMHYLLHTVVAVVELRASGHRRFLFDVY